MGEVVTGLVALAVRSDDNGVETAATSTTVPMPSTTTSPVTAPDETSTTTPPSPADERQNRVVEEIREQVAVVRGLEWKSPVKVQIAPQAELARRLRVLAEEELNRDEMVGYEAALKLVGLLPEELDLVDEFHELLGASVQGYYDGRSGDLFVASAEGGEISAITKVYIAHELTHALTDQHFDHNELGESLDGDDETEQAFALQSLTEGDAMLTQELWASRYLSEDEQAAYVLDQLVGGGGEPPDVPPYLMEATAFPYTEGRDFVAEIHDEGGFRAVDAAYRDPPTSSEQIIHPERYLRRQTWARPPLPDVAAAAGCQSLVQSTLGEFDMTQILGAKLGPNDAERAADGWNGDTLHVMRCGGANALVDRWQLDPGTDSQRLVEGLREWATARSGSGQAPDAEGRFSGPGGAGRIIGSPDRVDIVLARDAATAERLAQAVS